LLEGARCALLHALDGAASSWLSHAAFTRGQLGRQPDSAVYRRVHSLVLFEELTRFLHKVVGGLLPVLWHVGDATVWEVNASTPGLLQHGRDTLLRVDCVKGHALPNHGILERARLLFETRQLKVVLARIILVLIWLALQLWRMFESPALN